MVREELCLYRASSMCRRAWSILETASDSAWLQHRSWRKAGEGAGVVVRVRTGRPETMLSAVTTRPTLEPHGPCTHQSLKEFVSQWSQYCKYEELHINTWGSIFSREADIWAHIHSRSCRIIVPGVKVHLRFTEALPPARRTRVQLDPGLPSPGLLCTCQHPSLLRLWQTEATEAF